MYRWLPDRRPRRSTAAPAPAASSSSPPATAGDDTRRFAAFVARFARDELPSAEVSGSAAAGPIACSRTSASPWLVVREGGLRVVVAAVSTALLTLSAPRS